MARRNIAYCLLPLDLVFIIKVMPKKFYCSARNTRCTSRRIGIYTYNVLFLFSYIKIRIFDEKC